MIAKLEEYIEEQCRGNTHKIEQIHEILESAQALLDLNFAIGTGYDYDLDLFELVDELVFRL